MSCGLGERRECNTPAVEAGDQLAAEADPQSVVEQLVDEDRAACQVQPGGQTRQLEGKLAEGHCVVVGHDPFVLGADEQRQVEAGYLGEGAPRLGGLDGEAAIEIGDKLLVEIAVGLRVGANCVQTQLLRKAALEGAETALAPSTRLRRAGQDVPAAGTCPVRAPCSPARGVAGRRG